MKKVHFYECGSNNNIFAGGSYCGRVFYLEEKKYLTRNKKKVTCKSCRKRK